MRRSTRDILGGLAVLVICLIVYFGFRTLLARFSDGTSTELTEAEKNAVENFEKDRMQDSARQQAHWDSLHGVWAAEKAARADAKAARELAHSQRERAYADSQKVWAARRAQWATEKAERQALKQARQAHYDSIRASYPQKLPKGSMVDANSADTTLLKQIPGIGSYYAKKVVEYRNSLGGFVSVTQIDEIDGLPHGISSWFRIGAGGGAANVRKLNINKADFKTMVHHPYLNYEQTKFIANFRQRNGRIRGWEDLKGCGLFSDSDVARLTPYVSF